MPIQVLLVDDHEMVRAGLRALLAAQPKMEIVAEAGDGRTAVELALKLKPDVAVMDVSMPDMNGVEATRRILEGCPAVKVLALSMHTDKQFVVEMLRAGASGYVIKSGAFGELLQAIETIMDDQVYLSPRIAKLVVAEYKSHLAGDAPGVISRLTPREREVLQLIAEGHSTKEIAFMLGVSVKTIEAHRQQVMNKLDLHSVAELTKYAIREGLTGLET